jgi:WD40 repeat protein
LAREPKLVSLPLRSSISPLTVSLSRWKRSHSFKRGGFGPAERPEKKRIGAGRLSAQKKTPIFDERETCRVWNRSSTRCGQINPVWAVPRDAPHNFCPTFFAAAFRYRTNKIHQNGTTFVFCLKIILLRLPYVLFRFSPLLFGLVQRPILLKGHERSITHIQYNTDGDLIFTASKSFSPTVWRNETGERIGTYNGHGGAVWYLDVSGMLFPTKSFIRVLYAFSKLFQLRSPKPPSCWSWFLRSGYFSQRGLHQRIFFAASHLSFPTPFHSHISFSSQFVPQFCSNSSKLRSRLLHFADP